MKDFQKIVANVVAESQLDQLPKEIQPARVFTWDNDLSSQKDWDDFTGGQLVAHTTWDKNSYKAMLDISNLQYGISASSYWGMLSHNEQITLYTSDYIDMNGKMVTIGTDIETKYYALSYELQGFELGERKSKKAFYGKIVLVNIQRFLDNQFNDSNEAPIINIANGKLNSTITVPDLSKYSGKGQSDPNIKEVSIKSLKVPKMASVEVLFPNPAIMIGGIDFVANLDRDGNALADQNRLIKPTRASTKPKTLPINPYYCILPTQWNIPSIDNYGWTHPADRSNSIKTILATQSLGTAAQTGLSLAGSTGIAGKLLKAGAGAASGIATTMIGAAQKFFGDKGTLANTTAINSNFLSGESDPLKFFIQGDGAVEDRRLDENGYLEIGELEEQGDYIEVNQANGDFGKYGKSMSPANNNDFNGTDIYRALGLSTIKLSNDAKKIPAIATPYASGVYAKLKINDQKINDYLLTGSPRQRVSSGEVLPPMTFPDTWDIYVRNMFFRPDPYSFWNWPTLMPAEIGVWDVERKTDIARDTKAAVFDILGSFGTANKEDNSANKKRSFWNKTILVSQITENDLYDPNKTYSSYRYEFDKNAKFIDDFYQIQFTAITSSTVTVNILDENDNIIRQHIFNTQGLNVGTSASWGTVVQL